MAGKSLKASIIIGGGVSGAFRAALTTTKSGLKAIGDELARVERRQRTLGSSIDTFGRMGKNVDRLRQEYGDAARAADRLRASQSRLLALQSRIDANTARRQQLGGQLRGAVGAFGLVAAGAAMPIRSAVQFENAMLGVQKQVNGARDAAGNLTPVYFAMRREIQGLGRELPVATNEIADMVTAAARMNIPTRDLASFVRLSTKMSTAFEMPAAELTDSMGKIRTVFRIPLKDLGDLGDAINYLDDNAISKGSDIIRVMQGDLAGAATTIGLTARNSAALASTFLTLGESAERADTAASGMLRQLQIAKMNPKRFQLGVKLIGMTSEQLQKGMIADPQKMILDVLGRIKQLPKELQMEAVTRLFGKDWGGAIAKLANGVDEYRRQLALANGETAKGSQFNYQGSMEREFQARMKSTSAQWQITKNMLTEDAVAIGNALLPSVNSLMKGIRPVVASFSEWADKNPKLIKGIVGGALALSGLRVVTLGVAYAWTTVAGPVLRVASLIERFRGAAAIAETGGKVGRLAGIFLRVGSVVRTVGAAIAAIGGGPIAVAVAALTVGALIVRKYWQPIGAFLGGMFRGIAEGARPALAAIGEALAPLKPAWDVVAGAIGAAWNWVVKLLEPVHMTSARLQAAGNAGASFGRVLGVVIGGAVKALTTPIRMFVALGKAIGTAAGFLVVNFGGAWDRVKSIIGAAVDWIMRRVNPVLSIGSKVAGWFGGLFGNSASPGARPAGMPPAPRGRVAPPMPSPASRSATTVVDSSTHHYHVTQRPGEDSAALARRIEDERRRRQGVDMRGSLVDGVN